MTTGLHPDRLQKRAAWSRVYSFDFQPFAEVADGETLASPTVTVTPSGLTVGSPVVDEGTVQVRLSGGAAGVEYLLVCRVQTSSGSTLTVEGELWVS